MTTQTKNVINLIWISFSLFPVIIQTKNYIALAAVSAMWKLILTLHLQTRGFTSTRAHHAAVNSSGMQINCYIANKIPSTPILTLRKGSLVERRWDVAFKLKSAALVLASQQVCKVSRVFVLRRVRERAAQDERGASALLVISEMIITLPITFLTLPAASLIFSHTEQTHLLGFDIEPPCKFKKN